MVRIAGGLLRNDRDFRLFWSAFTVSLTGSAVSDIALPLTALLVLDASAAEVAALVAAERVPTVLFALFGGVVADRVRRRPIIIAESVVAAAALGSIPLAHALGWLTLAQLFVVAVVVKTAGAFGAPAFYAFVPTLTGRERLSDGIADIRASEVGVGVVGGPLGGALVAALTAPFAIVVDALSYLFSAALVSRVRAPGDRPAPAGVRPPLRGQIGAGMRAAVATPALRALTAVDAVALLVGPGLVGALYVVFLSRVLGLSAVEIGAVAGVGGVAGIAATRVVGLLRARIGLGPSLVAAGAGHAAATLLLALAPASRLGVVVAAASAALGAVAGVLGAVNAAALRQLSTPDGLRGRVGATMRLVLGTGVVAGASLAGVLTTVVGIRPILLGAAAVQVAIAIAVAVSPLRALRDLPSEPTPDPPPPGPPPTPIPGEAEREARRRAGRAGRRDDDPRARRAGPAAVARTPA